MPGIAKRKYVEELIRFNKKIKRPLYLIVEILPYDYNGKTLLDYFKKFYPYEWQ